MESTKNTTAQTVAKERKVFVKLALPSVIKRVRDAPENFQALNSLLAIVTNTKAFQASTITFTDHEGKVQNITDDASLKAAYDWCKQYNKSTIKINVNEEKVEQIKDDDSSSSDDDEPVNKNTPYDWKQHVKEKRPKKEKKERADKGPNYRKDLRKLIKNAVKDDFSAIIENVMQQSGVDKKKKRGEEAKCETPGNGNTLVFADQKVTKHEMKDQAYWPYGNSKCISQLFNKQKQLILRKFKLPIENAQSFFNICDPARIKKDEKVETMFEQSEGIVAIQGQARTGQVLTLITTFKIVRKAAEVECTNKVALFVDPQPNLLNLKDSVDFYMKCGQDEKATLESLNKFVTDEKLVLEPQELI